MKCMYQRAFSIIFFGFIFLASSCGTASNPKVHSEAMISGNYTYIDVGVGFFPIPKSFVGRASSLGDREVTELRFSIPVDRYERIAPHPSHFDTDRIHVRLNSDTREFSEPTSELLQTVEKAVINNLTIWRYKLKESRTAGLEALLNTCYDTVLVGEYHVVIISNNCELSSHLANNFIPIKQ
ncbi:MAG: hypothetical protein AB8B81_03730 [Halioglobus sp.]